MTYFTKAEIKQFHILSKKDIKTYIKDGCDYMNLKTVYKCFLLTNKAKVVTTDDLQIQFFTYYNTICHMFHPNKHNTIFVDKGAQKALERGAYVMAPGITKYIYKQPNFDKDEIVYISLYDNTVGVLFGIGITLMSRQECIQLNNGSAINVLYINDDSLNKIVSSTK